MEAGLDTGPVLLRQTTPIGPEETTSDLHDRLAQIGAALIVQSLAQLRYLTPEPQPDAGITYAAKIEKSESRIDWTRPATEVDRQIRALSPFPGAWCRAGPERLKLVRCRVAQGQGLPGQILHGLTVACGTGAIEIIEAQREGRRPKATDDLLRGFPLPSHLT